MPCAESAGLVDGLINLFAILNGKWGFLAFPCFIAVGFRKFTYSFDKQFRVAALPSLHGFDGGVMPYGFLWDVLIVEYGITLECRTQLFCTVEVGGVQYLADTPVKAFGHAVGLRVA